MPIEIRELIIRAYVEPDNKKDIKTKKDSSIDDQSSCHSSEAIVQLLEVINNKNER